jgi:hypothetical protein
MFVLKHESLLFFILSSLLCFFLYGMQYVIFFRMYYV